MRDRLGKGRPTAASHGPIRVETGSRGVGKTSLLKAVQDTAAEAGFVTVWSTAREDESLIGQVAHGLAEGLEPIGIAGGRDARLRDRIRTLSVELGTGLAKAGAEVDLSAQQTPAPPAARALPEPVTAGAAAAHQRGSVGVTWSPDAIAEVARRTPGVPVPRAALRERRLADSNRRGRCGAERRPSGPGGDAGRGRHLGDVSGAVGQGGSR